MARRMRHYVYVSGGCWAGHSLLLPLTGGFCFTSPRCMALEGPSPHPGLTKALASLLVKKEERRLMEPLPPQEALLTFRPDLGSLNSLVGSGPGPRLGPHVRVGAK